MNGMIQLIKLTNYSSKQKRQTCKARAWSDASLIIVPHEEVEEKDEEKDLLPNTKQMGAMLSLSFSRPTSEKLIRFEFQVIKQIKLMIKAIKIKSIKYLLKKYLLLEMFVSFKSSLNFYLY